MNETEFSEFIEKYDTLSNTGWIFWIDENGSHFVASKPYGNKVIERVEVCSAAQLNRTKEAFESIEYGMEIYDVVKIVGIPFRRATSGVNTLDFYADDGTIYRINVSGKNKTVLEVVLLSQLLSSK